MLSLIVPTYHERDNIEPLLQRIATVRGLLQEPIEVLVVDNQSEDGTAACAKLLLERTHLGRVIESTERHDLIDAVRQGIREAKGELIAVMDADLSHPPELLPQLVAAVRAGAELAIASRYVAGGGIRAWPWHRRVLSRLGCLMAQPLVGVHDATSGYFACRASLVKSLTLKGSGFKILMSILVEGCVHYVREVPYVFTDRVRGSSKLTRRVLGRAAAQLFALYRYRWNHPCTHKKRALSPPRTGAVSVESLADQVHG